MKKFQVAAILFALSAQLGCAPIYIVPGLRLGGAEVPTPDSWANVEVPEEVLLRTEGAVLPRVHRIWAVKFEGDIFVSGGPAGGWVDRSIADPNVMLRMGDDVYALRADQINDPAAQRRGMEAMIAKYRENLIELTGEEPDAAEMAAAYSHFRLSRL